MNGSRSKFYVDIPLGNEPPSQRHSMFADHSEMTHHLPPQDLSSASSSTTLPSTAGSVDRLNEKKSKKSSSRFFTLKPKTSFSLRPFFSSTSIPSLSSSSSSKPPQKKSSSTPRQLDSCVQTDEPAEKKKAYGEVGVQTLNASTVDVPVQTCFDEWDDSRHSYGNRRPFSSAAAHRPGFARGPSAAYYSNPPSACVPKSPKIGVRYPTDTKYSVVAPLDSSKILKYASPRDSSPAATSEEAAIEAADRAGVSESAKPSEVVVESVPVEGSAAKEPKSCETSSPNQLSCVSKVGITSNTGPLIQSNDQKLIQVINSVPSPTGPNLNSANNSESIANLHSVDKPHIRDEKLTPASEVSGKLITITHHTDRPSALKIERSDSPVKHSAKIKTVHFDLSDSDSSESNPQTNIKKDFVPSPLNDNNIKPRNIDKDFEDLLRNLDILVDDPIESSDSKSCDLKVSFNSTQSSPPKQTLLSSKLRSAFDILNQDVLPPILETANENSETEPSIFTKSNETDKIEPESNDSSSKINSIAKPVDEFQEYKHTSPTSELNKVESNSKSLANDSPKSTSVNTFITSKLDLVEEKDEKRENVYDSGITENIIKTVTLPTLPSFFDSTSKSKEPDLQPVVLTEVSLPTVSTVAQNSLDRDSEEKMLSRSSSRGSIRSNPTSDFNAFFTSTKKFDSCENLDQLEEEIIRSLCDPSVYNFNENDANHHKVIPALPVTESPDATQMRRAILDRLLSGESDEGMHSNRSSHVYTPEEIIEVPKSKITARQSSKHTATLTKFEHHRNKSPVESSFCSLPINYNQTKDKSLMSSDNISGFHPNEELDKNLISGSSPAEKIDSPNKNSVFYFPENKPLSAGVPEHSSVSLQIKDKSSTNKFNSSSFHEPKIQLQEGITEDDTRPEACDFTHCLRPSEIQNNSFLEKISSKPVSSRFSPEKSYSRTESPATVPMSESSETNVPNSNGHCDFANCLKPSQVQNSVFTAELSEITANKTTFGVEPHRTNSPLLTTRTNSPLTPKAPPSIGNKPKAEREIIPDNEVSHKSEVTIVLQPYCRKIPRSVEDQNQVINQPNDETIEVPPVYSMTKEPNVKKSLQDPVNQPVQEPSSVSTDTIAQQPPLLSNLEVNPPPPPPPPPPSKQGIKNGNVNSLQSMLQTQQASLVKAVPTTSEPKCAPNKSPVMMELEKRFETHRRHSSEDLDHGGSSQRKHSESDILEIRLNASPDKKHGSTENSSVFHHSPNATTYQCNGSNGSYSQPKDYASTNGKNGNGFIGREQMYSPTKTIITDEPPPPGAVLVDKKVTVEGDRVHTDKYYALPVKEMLRETTTTTKFIPAPPKYEGIGPTEDGVPIAPRNSVKKENMHNWYKTMFKSLHKADLSNDNQEYIIGYSSEPETSKKDKALRKKSSTLDNRNGNNNSMKSNDHLSRQPYPPSAKSSIDVYNVRPRLIEDYEPGHSSVTDDELTIGYKRYLPALNTPKATYEYKNGYEQDNNFIRNLSPFDPDPEQQKVWYKEIQKGGEIPQFGLGKPAPEKPKDPVIGPLPPPPLNYHGPTISQQATRPLTLPASYQTDNGICQQSNGPYEMQMRQVIHTELQQRISPSSSQLSSPSRSILKSPSRSPDLKIPARALFDFKAESIKEIPLKKDDVVLILRQLDKNWYEGEHQGRIGIFPINYVEIVPPEHASTPIKSFTNGSGKVLYDFTAHTSVELSVRKGDLVSLIRRVDNNWYEARFNSKKGIIPSSYLQVLQEPSEKNTLSPTPKPCLRSPRSCSEASDGYNKANPNSLSPSFNNTSPSMMDNSRGKFQSRSKKSSSLIEPVMYRALYSYSPMNSDELELVEGDTIYVVEMCDDGWYVGTSVRTGVFGIFPGNYVEKVW